MTVKFSFSTDRTNAILLNTCSLGSGAQVTYAPTGTIIYTMPTNAPGYTDDELAAFTNAYIECALWSSFDTTIDKDDMAYDTLNVLTVEAKAFFISHTAEILNTSAPLGEYWDGATDGQRRAAMGGHDFWLTQAGTGAGFWDGDWAEPYATTLDSAATSVEMRDLYIGDDGKVYA